MTVAQWSTTAGLNVLSSGTSGTGGTNIDEGCAPSGINNAIRDVMSQIATLITDANFVLTSTDAGASANPTLTLYRNSATPAVSDIIGKVLFQGEDSAGNTEDYAAIQTVITDPTSASEDAAIQFLNKVAGTMVTSATFSSGTFSFTSTDAGAGSGPILQLVRNSASPAASDTLGQLLFVGNDAAANATTYADASVSIVDTTDGSEDGTLTIRAMVAGTLTNRIVANAAGVTLSGTVSATAIEGATIGAVTPATGAFTTITGSGATLTSTDAGATAGPVLDLYRNSASPANSDIIGLIRFSGKDAGGNLAFYGDIFGTIADTTDGSEDGTISIRPTVAGAQTVRAAFGASGSDFTGDTSATGNATAVQFKLTSTVFWSKGTGTPEGAVTAAVGSIYSRTDGGASTSFYVKESGSGNTGWVAK